MTPFLPSQVPITFFFVLDKERKVINLGVSWEW